MIQYNYYVTIRLNFFPFAIFWVMRSFSFSVPTAPPSGVGSLIVNNTCVVISWRPPPRARTNGRLSAYHVWLMENKTSYHSNITLPGEQLSLTLHNLTFKWDYAVVVAASTRYFFKYVTFSSI